MFLNGGYRAHAHHQPELPHGSRGHFDQHLFPAFGFGLFAAAMFQATHSEGKVVAGMVAMK